MIREHYPQNYGDHFGDAHCVLCEKPCKNPRKLISRAEMDGINQTLRERVRFEESEYWKDALSEIAEAERQQDNYCLVCKTECSNPVSLITEAELDNLDQFLRQMSEPIELPEGELSWSGQ